MTIKECSKLIAQLEGENNPANEKLIAYYKKAIQDAINTAVSKAITRAFAKR